jgi:methionine-rich copper-binding protein CopC
MSPFRSTPPSLNVFAGSLFLVGFLAAGSAALAHNVVEERIPIPETTVTESPVEVSISTDDLFLDVGDNRGAFAIVMQDEAGLYYGDGCVELAERQMTASINLGDPGLYVVIYQFVSADGHALSESYSVYFEPEATHQPTQGIPVPPVCGVDYQPTEELLPVEPDTAEPAIPQVTTEPPRTASIPVWAWLGGPLVLAGVAGLWWFRNRKKPAGS